MKFSMKDIKEKSKNLLVKKEKKDVTTTDSDNQKTSVWNKKITFVYNKKSNMILMSLSMFFLFAASIIGFMPILTDGESANSFSPLFLNFERVLPTFVMLLPILANIVFSALCIKSKNRAIQIIEFCLSLYTFVIGIVFSSIYRMTFLGYLMLNLFTSMNLIENIFLLFLWFSDTSI